MIIFGLEVVQSSSSAMMDGSVHAGGRPGGASVRTLIWDNLRSPQTPFSLPMMLSNTPFTVSAAVSGK